MHTPRSPACQLPVDSEHEEKRGAAGVKPRSEFYVDRFSEDGLRSNCKVCVRALLCVCVCVCV
jgi:hypothetical protein